MTKEEAKIKIEKGRSYKDARQSERAVILQGEMGGIPKHSQLGEVCIAVLVVPLEGRIWTRQVHVWMLPQGNRSVGR